MSRHDTLQVIRQIVKESGAMAVLEHVMDGMSLNQLNRLANDVESLSPTYQNLKLAADALASYGVLPNEAAEVAEIARKRVGMDNVGAYISECFRVWNERKDKRRAEVDNGEKKD